VRHKPIGVICAANGVAGYQQQNRNDVQCSRQQYPRAFFALYAISPETLAIRVDKIRCELVLRLARVQGELPDEQFDVLLDRMALQRFREERRPVEFSR
jgi:hypothetical protein